MADLPTRAELFRRWRDAALGVPGTRVSARSIDTPGSDLNILGNATAFMAEEIVNRAARGLAGVFEDTATGTRLDRVIADRKGLPRKGAAPAVGIAVLTRPNALAGAGTIDGGLPGSGPPEPTRIQSSSGKVYLLVEDAVFGAAALGPVQVRIQAELAGTGEEVDGDQTWTFLDVPFDPSIEIDVPDGTAGAEDEESDPAYRRRSKQFFRTIRRGTIPAIEFGLLSTGGVASASVVEATNPATGFPACEVQGFVLDPLGRSNETLAARGALNLLESRGAGIPVRIFVAVPQFVEIEFAGVEFDTAVVLDTSQAADDVRSQIVAALNNQRGGRKLLRSTILAAARQVPGFLAEDEDLIEPAGTLIPASPDVIFRTRRELITINAVGG